MKSNILVKIMANIEKSFEFFDVTADVGFIAYGKTLEESFENSALAMFNVISNTDTIGQTKSFEFSIESEDEISLLYDFLEELLFLHEVEFMLFSEFKVKITNEDQQYKLKAKIKGEKINWDVHERGCEVKAITFHQMNVSSEDGIYKTRAILDL